MAQPEYVRNGTSTFETLFPVLKCSEVETSNFRLTSAPIKTTETEVLHINPATGVVSRGQGATAPPTNLAGFSYVNTTNVSILSIPQVLTIVPINYAVSPSITRTFNWQNEWDILASPANNNRFVYTGATNKRFVMRVDVQLSSAGTSSTTYMALYRNGSCLTNGIVAQTSGAVGAINPSVETLHFEIPFTTTGGANDYFELYTYGTSTGISIAPITTATLFTPNTIAPSISIIVEEIQIA